jgi:hypothetical protein
MPDEARDVLMFVSLVLFVILMFVLGITLLSDVSWCVENYAPSDIPHCMHYENSVYGKYVQPPLLLEDWVGRNECYSAEFR